LQISAFYFFYANQRLKKNDNFSLKSNLN
jgi:hypothetical protein